MRQPAAMGRIPGIDSQLAGLLSRKGASWPVLLGGSRAIVNAVHFVLVPLSTRRRRFRWNRPCADQAHRESTNSRRSTAHGTAPTASTTSRCSTISTSRMREFVTRQEMMFVATSDRARRVRQHLPRRAARVHPRTRRQAPRLPRVPRQRGHGQPRQHQREPAHRAADPDHRQGRDRAAHQRRCPDRRGPRDARRLSHVDHRSRAGTAARTVGRGSPSTRRTSTAPSICRGWRRSRANGTGAPMTSSARAATSSAPKTHHGLA